MSPTTTFTLFILFVESGGNLLVSTMQSTAEFKSKSSFILTSQGESSMLSLEGCKTICTNDPYCKFITFATLPINRCILHEACDVLQNQRGIGSDEDRNCYDFIRCPLNMIKENHLCRSGSKICDLRYCNGNADVAYPSCWPVTVPASFIKYNSSWPHTSKLNALL